jgi:hypothetical protein
LVRSYYKIRESKVRKSIFEMVKAVGAASHAEILAGQSWASQVRLGFVATWLSQRQAGRHLCPVG